jgi:hypothetical protein
MSFGFRANLEEMESAPRDERTVRYRTTSWLAEGRTFFCFVIASVLFHWKVLLTHQFSFLTAYEGVNQAYSWYQFILSSFRSGKIPVWDPFTFSGHSFIGEMQTGAFYPGNFILALVPFNRNGLFSPAAYHAYVALTHAVAGYLMFRLIRRFGLGWFAGFLAGITFAFGQYIVSIPGWPHLLESAIWLPAVFELLLMAWRERKPARALLKAGFSGILLGVAVLAGGLHLVIMDGIVVFSAGCYLWLQSRRPQTDNLVLRIGGAGILVVTGTVLVAALGTSCIQLLPSTEYSHLSYRFLGAAATPASQRIPYAYLENDHLWPYSFLMFLFPEGFGGNTGTGEVISPYIGVFPILLAAIGIWWRREDSWCRYFAGLALASFIYAMGSFSWLHGLGYALIPDLWLAREASRFTYLASFSLVILSAFGAEALFNSFENGLLPGG